MIRFACWSQSSYDRSVCVFPKHVTLVLNTIEDDRTCAVIHMLCGTKVTVRDDERNVAQRIADYLGTV